MIVIKKTGCFFLEVLNGTYINEANKKKFAPFNIKLIKISFGG